MKQVLEYKVADLVPYINWSYFFHAWSLSGKSQEAQEELRHEAEAFLADNLSRYPVRAVFGLFDAQSEDDDIWVEGIRLPMLRQQRPSRPGAPCLCLADFIRPRSLGGMDRIGVFATSSDKEMVLACPCDVYQHMMAQTLADRLAEAAAECMHQEVRRHYWGYAPHEELSMAELHAERFQGIRPAVGYPSLPDASINFLLNRLIDMGSIGIRLTESGMMQPHASVSGLLFAHPQARYFQLGKIDEEQLRDYARRRELPLALVRRFLQV